MASPAGALLQLGSPDAPTGMLVALGVLVLAVLLLAVRGLVDWLLGPEPETATYRLVETEDGLELVDADEAKGRRLVGLEPEDVRDLLDRAERRNEMRLHVVLERDGTQRHWEDWRREEDRQPPAGLILEDSKGLVEIHDAGRVKATPPLDDAVRGDLMDVLRATLER